MISGKRIGEIDVLRGIAAILMILGHSFIVYPVDISGVPWCSSVQHFIYTFHMELFFVLAGIVYYCAGYGRFIKKKFRKILVPYLFFGTAALLLRAFGGTAINGTEPLGEGIYNLVFHGGGYWFLYTLFLIFAVYPWIDKVCTRKIWLAVLAAALLILRDFVELPGLFAVGTVVRYLPYFIFGHCISGLIRSGETVRKLR